jgi:hypothetical protein
VTSITAPTSAPARRPGPLAAAVLYPVAWVAGLALVAGPAIDAAPEAISAHYVSSGGTAALQSVLVHGVAAGALLVVGLAVARTAHGLGRGLCRSATVAVWVAVATSLAQMVLGILAATRGGEVDLVATIVGAITRLDALKMVALAVLVGTGALVASRRGLPTWLAPSGAVLTATLLVAASGYALLAPGPAVAAVVALPLLLVWVCAAGVGASRR